MAVYKPLTKTETDKDGNEIVVCRFAGTPECRAIHTSDGCNNCPVLKAVFQMLHTFEEVYLSEENNEHCDCN